MCSSKDWFFDNRKLTVLPSLPEEKTEARTSAMQVQHNSTYILVFHRRLNGIYLIILPHYILANIKCLFLDSLISLTLLSYSPSHNSTQLTVLWRDHRGVTNPEKVIRTLGHLSYSQLVSCLRRNKKIMTE